MSFPFSVLKALQIRNQRQPGSYRYRGGIRDALPALSGFGIAVAPGRLGRASQPRLRAPYHRPDRQTPQPAQPPGHASAPPEVQFEIRRQPRSSTTAASPTSTIRRARGFIDSSGTALESRPRPPAERAREIRTSEQTPPVPRPREASSSNSRADCALP